MLHQVALAAVLKGLRNTYEVSQDKTPGIDLSYIQKIERAKGNPTIQMLDELAQAFSIDVTVLTALISAYSRDEDPADLLSSALRELKALKDDGALAKISEALTTPAVIGRPPLDKGDDVARTAQGYLAEGMSYSEIAEKMGISKTSVYRYLKKGTISS